MTAATLTRFVRSVRPIPAAQLTARAHGLVRGTLYRWWPADPIGAATRAAGTARAAAALPRLPLEVLAPDGLDAVCGRAAEVLAGRLTFVGVTCTYDRIAAIAWDQPHPSALWGFNLHYLAPILDLTLTGHVDAAAALLASWRRAVGGCWHRVAWHPYPTSLRLAYLCLAAGHLGAFEALATDAAALAAMHAAFLLRHLEHDLRGNHLLENARALLLAGRCLEGPLAAACERAACAILAREVPEQVLPDGAHFELSPMYHAIVLHRLVEMATVLGDAHPLVSELLGPAIVRMATFLRAILCPDGEIPLLGDSARGVAPPPAALLALATRHGRVDEPAGRLTSLPDCGLHVWRSSALWAILDAGPLCPRYLPGHGQADSLTVEVWCDGVCLVSDPGVYDYTGPERTWGRSSRAHSTITIDDRDTSEVYGSFRVGGRARIANVRVEGEAVTATLEPWGIDARCTRTVAFADSAGRVLVLTDRVDLPTGHVARSRLHLHPAVRIAALEDEGTRLTLGVGGRRMQIRAAAPLRLECGRTSREFGRIDATTVVVQDLTRDTGSVAQGWFRLEVVG